ncbi:methionine synthase reductase [Rhipicephalus microplus]|uniref:methionine synthase reductase n=1 Tax=Rhipicephalus microplus TaxID=6941 RepID=UPI002376B17D
MRSDTRAGSRRFLLLYASQTGQAEAIARRLNNAALERGFLPDLHCVSAFGREFDLAKEGCFLLVTSTTDEGLVPENARRFLRYLRKAPDGLLSGTQYAVLGLGDTNYNNFCNGARTFESQFDALGATRFYETGYADDAVGLETVVEPWIAELWKALRSAVISGAAATTESREEDPLPIVAMEDGSLTSSSMSASTELTLPLMKDPVVCVQFDSSSAAVKRTTDSDVVWQGGQPLPFQESDVFHVALTSAKRLTSSEKVKEAWELEFQLPSPDSEPSVSFKPGDSFGFLCVNRPAEVTFVVERLGVPGSQLVVVTHAPKARNMDHLPKAPITVERLLTTCCDLRGIPKKIFLRTLAEFTAETSDKRRLLELSSREGSKDYMRFILEGRNTFLDVLRAFPSCKPPLAPLLEHLPRLLPRYYSVCSWSSQDDSVPHRFRILYKRCPIPGRDEEGLCTGWLTDLARKWLTQRDIVSSMTSLSLSDSVWSRMPIYLRKNASFHFPDSLSTPVIMIGPGSGVAPFLSYLQWRKGAMNRSDRCEVSETWLFTGFRHRHLDFLYEDEFCELVKQNVLSKLVVSFSRDAGGGDAVENPEMKHSSEDELNEEDLSCSILIRGGKYVQDSMRLWSKDIARLTSLDNSHVYVCGDAVSMATSVRDTFTDILVDEGIVASKEDGLAFVKELQKQGRYLEDIWTA